MLSKKDGETEKNKQTNKGAKKINSGLTNVSAWLIVDDSFLKQGRNTRQN